LIIRKAMLSDSREINKLSEELGYHEVSQDTAYNRLSAVLESNSDGLWVYEEDAQLKGWIHFFIVNKVASPPFVEIGGLVVSAQYRRNGVGKNLINFVKARAAASEMKVRVRCNAKRIQTHKFYQAMGFATVKNQLVFEYENQILSKE